MELSTFLYDMQNQWEKNDYFSDRCSDYNYKSQRNKHLFRMQSPVPSFQGDSVQEENERSYDDEFNNIEFPNKEQPSESCEESSQNSKKTKKDIKLRRKEGKKELLSEREFIQVMKKIEQCRQVKDLIDSMALILGGFKSSLQKKTCLTLTSKK